MKDVIEILKNKADNKNISIELDIPEINIYADETKFKWILYSLISNAIKFTPEGGSIILNAILLKDSIQISVIDTGIGIKPEDQKRIFNLFEQVDMSYTRQYEKNSWKCIMVKSGYDLNLEKEALSVSLFP
ncbi:MAG TPA: HAMP domain-containing histidine kinase [Methanosarcinales archaeon]|nr:HAMP domain-containing histidine kinase [Methanosarcinales archaeon]